jgi:hypothetical protein
VITYVLAWFPMVVLAIANGAFRETTYGKRLPDLRAHQLSTLTGGILMGLYIAVVARVWPFASAGQSLAVGALWVAMTIAFEFGFGRLRMGRSWAELLRDYDLRAGRVWGLFLLWLGAAPWVMWRAAC